MYRQRYQLDKDPFAKGMAAKDAYQSTDFKECTGRLDYLAQIRGIGLVVAAPGYGKSFCMRAFAERQNHNLVNVVYICMTSLSAIEFYRQLSAALGLEPLFRKADMFRAIQEYIVYASDIKHMHVIIVIDEAQYLGVEILRDLKMLANFDFDSKTRFSLVLVGQPQLADYLSRQVHEPLRQRIVANYTFAGLSPGEAAEYAQSMLRLAGGSASLFDDAALNAAYSGSNRAIRVFGQILTTSLRIGQHDAVAIDADMVMAAINELSIK